MKTIKFKTTVRRQRQRIKGKGYMSARINSVKLLPLIGKKVCVVVSVVK